MCEAIISVGCTTLISSQHSSLADAALPADAVYFGEISLSGAIRPVAQTAARLKEAQKLGFVRAVLPEAARAEAIADPGLSLRSVGSLATLVADIAGQRSEVRGRRSDERGQRPEVAGRKVDVR